jgi:NDP-sugar pyrophosphorylase family protein
VTTPAADAPRANILVMAGGTGTRMASLTAHLPKPMLPVGGQPILGRVLDALHDEGVRRLTIAVGPHADVVTSHFGDGSSRGLDIAYIVEAHPLGTAGAVSMLRPSAEPVIVINADVLAAIPVRGLLAFHSTTNASITLATVEERVRVPYGVIDLAVANVVRILEKPTLSVVVAAGVYVLAPHVVAAVHPGSRIDMPELIGQTLRHDRVAAYPLPGPWLDVGTPEAYARAQSIYEERPAPVPSQLATL